MDRRRPPLSVLSPLLLVLACALDVALPPIGLAPVAWLALALLCVALGALHGACWDAAFALLARLPRSLAAGVWFAASAGFAFWLCDDLGGFARLRGAYHGLALLTLIACGALAPALAVVLIALQPSARHRLGLLPGAPPRVRYAGALVLAVTAAACFAADRRVFVGLYPSAHLALRALGLWLASFACATVNRVPVGRVRGLWLAPLLAAGLAVALAARDEDGVVALTLRPWPALVIDAGRRLTDFDRDGYSQLLAGGDCAPFDRHVHPAAAEIPDNGRDDNCLLGDASATAPDEPGTVRAARPSPLDLVLITVDSLRADRVGAYLPASAASALATTPQLDAFARDALVFDRAYTPGGWTSIAISALMRGVYPRRLAWTPLFETNEYRLIRPDALAALPPGERAVKMFPLPLSDPRATLAAWLTQRGMRTIAVVDDGFSELLSRRANLAPGFQVVREVDGVDKARRGDQGTAELALSELARVPAGQRFFLWVHFFGPHSPNSVHPQLRLDGDRIEQGYEHEVRYLDQQLGRLLQALAARARPTAVFVTADHGEEFIAGGRHHGWSLNDDVVHVPLIARVPGWPRGRSQLPVSLVDLMPSLCALSEASYPAGLDGLALGPLLLPGAAVPARVLFADTWRYDRKGSLLHAESAAFDGDVKVLYEPLDGSWSRVERAAGGEPRTPIPASSPLRAVRALSAYVEAANGPLALHD